MSSISIEIEAFAGAAIEDVCHDAMVVADILAVVVMFEFNGIRCMARPGDDSVTLADDWRRLMAKENRHPHEIAVGRRA